MMLFIFTFVISIMTSLRVFGYDRDYFSYQRFYEKISIGGYSSRFEPGFELVANLFKTLAGLNSFTLFLFFIAFVSLYLKFSILSNIRHYSLLILIYIMLIFPLHEMMQIRIALATGIMYWALYKSTHSNINFLKRAILVGVGVSMHYSVVILAPFVLFDRIFYKHSRVLIALLVAIILPVIINLATDTVTYFLPMVQHYLLQIEEGINSDINLFSSRNIILSTILFIGLLNIKYIPKEKLVWLYVSIAGMGIWYGFLWLPVFAHRFLEITIFSYLVWVPSLPKISRIISLGLLFVLAVYFLVRTLFVSPFFT